MDRAPRDKVTTSIVSPTGWRGMKQNGDGLDATVTRSDQHPTPRTS